jgi:hypothetical protein
VKNVFVATLILALTIVAEGQVPSEKSTSPEINAKLTKAATLSEFTFRFPENWQVGKQGQMMTISPANEMRSENSSIQRKHGLNVLVMPIPPEAKPDDIKPEDVLNTVFQQASESSGAMQRAGASVGIPVDGHPAAMLVYRDASAKNESQQFGLMLVVRGSNNVAYFRMFCPFSEGQSGWPLFKAITDSIRISK